MAERKRNELKNTLKLTEENPSLEALTDKNDIEEDVVEGLKEKGKSAVKEEEKKKTKPRKVINDGKKEAKGSTDQPAFYKTERFRKVSGLLLVLGSAFLFVAFTSFFFTWKVDYDKVTGGLGKLFSSETKVENWLGKVGALSSHLFVYKWFGIGAFAFVLVSFLLGVKILFQLSLLPLEKTFRISLFALLWTSLTLGFIFGDSEPLLGGGFGFFCTLWLYGIIGKMGVGLLLGFAFLLFLVIGFNINFNLWGTNTAGEAIRAAAPTPTPLPAEPVVPIHQQPELIPLESETPAEDVTTVAMNTFIEKKEEGQAIELNPVLSTIISAPPAPSSEVDFTVEAVKEELVEEVVTEDGLPFGEYDPKLDLSRYQMPPLDLLEVHAISKEASVNADELNANKDRIVTTLNNYGIQIDKIKATIGPTVTLYEIIPAAGVRISKIKNLEDDIALSLSALGIRIIAPIPGKGTIGIEVPNMNPEMVSMRSILASERFQNTTMDLPVALGKTISNETFIADLSKMPHLLMAGATGQGKSVGLNAILVSLLYKKHPSQIKLVLVDPKKVELTLFNKIEKHFLAKLPDSAEAIITDTKKVIHTLNSLCIEMDQRYDLLKEAQVRNIKEYNSKFIARKLNPNKGHKFLPYIVLVVDEFADLIMTAGKEVETPIARLAQLARAIGIHLIIATQRPSVNIITGTIKANFPARIAFRVTSKIDSRTILDSGGADQLIGRGDMLLSTGNDLIRIQCAFVDTPEVDRITAYISSQQGYPSAFILPEYVEEGSEDIGGGLDAADRDPLFEEAARMVVQHQQGSASLLQRRMKLGYNRAGRLIDQLAEAGIIGPHEGSKAREVLIKDMMSLEQFLGRSSNII